MPRGNIRDKGEDKYAKQTICNNDNRTTGNAYGRISDVRNIRFQRYTGE